MPKMFFMTLHDIAFWINSAKSDTSLAQMQKNSNLEESFNSLYRNSSDPWACSDTKYRYQLLKYSKLIALLPKREYRKALDVGCGLGMMSRLLAPYIGEGLGIELSQVAVENAAKISRSFPNLSFKQGDITKLGETVEGKYDLIVLADVLYYLSPLNDTSIKGIIQMIEDLLEPGGIVLIANHFFFDLDPQSAIVRQIHASFRWAKRLTLLHEDRQPFYLASVLQKMNE